jgi:hypothetical protein
VATVAVLVIVVELAVAAVLVTAPAQANSGAVAEVVAVPFKASIAAVARRAAPAAAAARAGEVLVVVEGPGVEVVEEVEGGDEGGRDYVSVSGFQVHQDCKVWNIGKMEHWNIGNTQYSSIPAFHIRDVTRDTRPWVVR